MNILFIEDHVLVRESLIYVFKQLREDVFVIESSNISDAIQLIQKVKSLDMVILDIGLPGIDGLSALPNLREILESWVPIIVLTGSDESDIFRKSKEKGATDCIHKNCNRHELINRLSIFVDVSTVQMRANFSESSVNSVPSEQIHESIESLTLREKEVLELVAKGDQDKVIAYKLGISVGTTKNHISKILLKLSVPNRMCAVLKAVEMKLLSSLV
ncbi:MAG: response regulator transcription factor [Burkholderiales bacterium]|nr:response regulator transcription factor [Burkholderiales bacterium]MDR4515885.1 response regulator transcription factor [Nitrosomonas sp.]